MGGDSLVAGRPMAATDRFGGFLGNWAIGRWFRIGSSPRVQHSVLTMLELVAIVMWSGVITRPYLELDPTLVPIGNEYPSIIHTHHLWTRLLTCGLCAMWNGSTQGGWPAFADPYSSTLHPLVMVATVGWGVSNGAKLALAGAFLMAGLAQWWLGRVLGLGRVACVWSACMAVAGGHLAGRMEGGAFVGVVSTAACALLIPPLISLMRTGRRRSAVQLGVVSAFAAVAGQGYYQAGFVFTLPAAVLLLGTDRQRWVLILRRFILAGGIAVLLAAPFLIPLAHFAPAWAKQVDPGFNAVQPFAYVPLNLVIDDIQFHGTELLGKRPHPALNVIFIGWLPLLLAFWGLHKAWRGRDRSVALYLLGLALLSFWFASGVPLRWLATAIPIGAVAEQITGLRFGSVLAGLAIAPILGLAAMGLDKLLQNSWPTLSVQMAPSTGRPIGVPLTFDSRLLLLIPLAVALMDAKAAGQYWIGTQRIGPEVPLVLGALKTPDLQWVEGPWWQHYWVEPAVTMGLKLGAHVDAGRVERFRWRDHPVPDAVLWAGGQGPPPGMHPTPKEIVNGMPIYAAPPGREYAAVTHPSGGRTVCTARGVGGDVDVACATTEPGTLTVFENNWSGWQAYVDWQGASLRPGTWLSVEVPAGRHEIQLRYRPWDVPVGLALGLAGMALAVWAWRRGEDREPGGPQEPSDGVDVRQAAA